MTENLRDDERVVPTAVKGTSRGDGVAQVELVAAPATSVVAGRTVELLTYNGAFPGPLLRFREGDRVRIRLTNRLGEPTNLHLHGLHIPPAADDPMLIGAPAAIVCRSSSFKRRDGQCTLIFLNAVRTSDTTRGRSSIGTATTHRGHRRCRRRR